MSRVGKAGCRYQLTPVRVRMEGPETGGLSLSIYGIRRIRDFLYSLHYGSLNAHTRCNKLFYYVGLIKQLSANN